MMFINYQAPFHSTSLPFLKNILKSRPSYKINSINLPHGLRILISLFPSNERTLVIV